MIYVALARIGAVLVPTMPIYRHDEVLYVLQHSGAKVSVVAGEFRGFDYPDMITTSGLGARPAARGHRPERRAARACCGSRTSSPATGSGRLPLGPPPSADAPHCIIYTSGTESRPKGCLHTLNTITFTVHALGGDVMAMTR